MEAYGLSGPLPRAVPANWSGTIAVSHGRFKPGRLRRRRRRFSLPCIRMHGYGNVPWQPGALQPAILIAGLWPADRLLEPLTRIRYPPAEHAP